VSELTLLILRLAFLALLWAFIFAVVYALRTDLFGQRVRKLPAEAQGVASTFPASATAAPLIAAPLIAAPVIAAAAAPVAARVPAPAPATPAAAPSAFTEIISPAAAANNPNTSAPTGPAKRLVITSGPKEGLEIELPSEQLTIGRSSESGLVIRDDYTSTHHARLMLWNQQWMVQDLDSTNGTFLDGVRVTVPTPVALNTPITIGTTSFELRR
jgi:Inner membrane component of T3SS, cytoplasmic domain